MGRDLTWHEIRRFQTSDGLVHVTLMQLIDGVGGRSRWQNCGVYTGAEVSREVPITCLSCLSRKGG